MFLCYDRWITSFLELFIFLNLCSPNGSVVFGNRAISVLLSSHFNIQCSRILDILKMKLYPILIPFIPIYYHLISQTLPLFWVLRRNQSCPYLIIQKQMSNTRIKKLYLLLWQYMTNFQMSYVLLTVIETVYLIPFFFFLLILTILF